MIQGSTLPPFDRNLGPADPLDAEGAFFHYAPAADRYVRIQLVPQPFGPDRLPVIEEPDLVRAVVGTITGTHTAVVYLNVHTFIVVVGRKHRTNRLARSVFTVLTHDGNEPSFDVREFAFPIPLDSDPLVGPPLQEQILGINRQVIFRLTSDNTGLTTGAPVEVYYHAPFMIDSR